MPRAIPLRRTASLALFLAVASSAHAEDYTWYGISGNQWNEQFNWLHAGSSIGVPPSSYATNLLFTSGGGVQLASNNNIPGTLNLGAITFGNRDGWALSGNALGFNVGTITANNSASVANAISVASGLTSNVAAGKTLSLSGAIFGAGALTKSGEGILTLSGAVTTGGGLTVNAGTVNILGTLGNSSLYSPTILNGGTLNLAGSAYVSDLSMASKSTVSGSGTINLIGNATLNGTIGTNIALSQGSSHTFNGSGTISGVISGNTDVTFFPTGQFSAITLAATNTYTGTTTVNGGELEMDASEAFGRGGDLVLNDSRIYLGTSVPEIAVTQTLSALNGKGFISIGNLQDRDRNVRNTLVLDIAGSSTFQGAFSGLGDVIKRGGGAFNYKVDTELISQAFYLGHLNVEAGTMNLSGAASGTRNLDVAAGAILNQSSGGLNVFSGLLSGTGTIRLNGGLSLSSTSSTFAGKISGAGPLSFGDSGRAGSEIDLSNIDFSGYTGIISASNSALSITNAPALPTLNLTNGALLNLREDSTANTTLATLTGTTGTTLAKKGTGNLRIGSASFGGLTRIDAGTVTVNRDALYRSTDGISVAQGATLLFGGGSAAVTTKTLTNAGTIVGSGSVSAAFANSATGTVRTNPAERLAFSGDVTNNGTFSLVGDGEIDVAGKLTNAAGAFVTGRGTLNTGGLISSGTMAFSGGSSDVYGKTSLLAGSVVQNSGGGALTFWDDVVHNGTEIRTNAGSYTTFKGSVSGAGAYTGPGTVEFDGDLRPGNSPASVSFGGNLVLANTNKLVMELGGTSLGTGYDHLNVGGTAFLGGALDVVTLNGFNPMAGQSFDLFDLTARQGTFSAINLPTLGNDLAWNTSALYTTGTLSVQAVPEPATLAVLTVGGLALLRRRKASKRA